MFVFVYVALRPRKLLLYGDSWISFDLRFDDDDDEDDLLDDNGVSVEDDDDDGESSEVFGTVLMLRGMAATLFLLSAFPLLLEFSSTRTFVREFFLAFLFCGLGFGSNSGVLYSVCCGNVLSSGIIHIGGIIQCIKTSISTFT